LGVGGFGVGARPPPPHPPNPQPPIPNPQLKWLKLLIILNNYSTIYLILSNI